MSYTFFGIQVAVKAFHKDPFRTRLHQAIASAPAEQSLLDKRKLWKNITALLNQEMPVFELGYWDLVRGKGRDAEQEFETWTSEIEGSLATEPAEVGAAPDEANRLSAHKGYILVSCLVLVAAGSNSDLTLGERCDLPEARWWSRQTFARLLAGFPLLNFGEVLSDAVYMAPGNDSDGLSMEDLRGEGYEYLHPLE